jgi:hypothetical protein
MKLLIHKRKASLFTAVNAACDAGSAIYASS